MKFIALAAFVFLASCIGPPAYATSLEADLTAHTTASCTGTTGAALAVNTDRRAALLINDSTSVIWIRVGEASVANEGIRLNANGGSYYLSFQDANFDTDVINCITGGTTNVLLVVEWSNP